MTYDPPRRSTSAATGDPLEIDLVLNVRCCGTCKFFWPSDSSRQPYGPYPTYDFSSNTPTLAEPVNDPVSFPWVTGKTRPPGFPDAEVMDGCRKAPIMTIGINPNLTAFLPGQTGASWCYPSFSSEDSTDPWAKYAYYYRYRSVYQERFDLEFAKQFMAPHGRIVAPKSGRMVSAQIPSDAPSYKIAVRYDGDAADTSIDLPGKLGEPRYVLLFNTSPPNDRFKSGDVIAARLDVPAGRSAQVFGQQIGYYERIVPLLQGFEAFLKEKGHSAQLRVGEDVGQLDMVACASPHWGPEWLGGSNDSVGSIINNCVKGNGWAVKQLLQTQPAVLILVGEASFDMFRYAFGALIKSNPVLPNRAEDGAFTLLRATADIAHPCMFEFQGTFGGHPYSIATRLIVAPHFSYGSNYVPQFRLSPADWQAFEKKFAACSHFLKSDPRIVPGTHSPPFVAFEIHKDLSHVLAQIKRTWPDAAAILMRGYYDATAMMQAVLEDLYANKQLSYVPAGAGKTGHLARGGGPCAFCDNKRWKFPQGCPYGKPQETPLPAGLLEQVAAEVVRAGSAPAGHGKARQATSRMFDDGFEARRAPPSALDLNQGPISK
ncbi:MAG TPA: hypothetical protein VK743_15295 [Steroidobacteraceae bacterium]|nr:hypothetical protein [Steroidobacteraceae bacterium]